MKGSRFAERVRFMKRMLGQTNSPVMVEKASRVRGSGRRVFGLVQLPQHSLLPQGAPSSMPTNPTAMPLPSADLGGVSLVPTPAPDHPTQVKEQGWE